MMRYWLFFILLGALVGISHLSIAQPEKDNKFNDTNSNTIKTPALEKDTVVNTDQDKKKVNPNLNNPLIDAQTDPVSNDEVTIFNLNKQPSLVSEDLYNIDMGESEVVRVVEEINIGDVNDPAWVKIAEYYKIWDTQQINPYGKDAKSFSEVVYLKLYDPSIGQLWASPLESTYTTSGFGPRWGRYHHGIDLHLYTGTPIYSVFDGVIRISGFNSGGYGYYVVVRHYNGLETLYGHMSALKVESGQKIKAGQLIGLGGSTGYSTGPHLHFEVRYQGNSINPNLIFDFSGAKITVRMQDFILTPEHFQHYGNQIRMGVYHSVMLGETLETISQKYNVPIDQLEKNNDLKSPELWVGQRLRIR